MHVHILGICGTFMAGLALIARELGHRVTGSDQHCYPPMSTLLEEQEITIMEGNDPRHLNPRPDLVVVGNALSRGQPLVEQVLNEGLSYTSGPQWLAEHVLQQRSVLAVAGTHGKTTTSSMLAWILETHDRRPGFLIGGKPGNFTVSARLGKDPLFVIEADEYDTAFFDKRSKFVHYRPKVLIINGIEYDHADIFPDLAAIEIQFHHLIRTVPGNGMIIHRCSDATVERVLKRGCWTPCQDFGSSGGTWRYQSAENGFERFDILQHGQPVAHIRWSLYGEHNACNATAAVAAAAAVGVPPNEAGAALSDFAAPRRRLQQLGQINGITVIDDFAHHPTAIRVTLEAIRAKAPKQRITAVLEPRSNTMRTGANAAALPNALAVADRVFILRRPDLNWEPDRLFADCGDRVHLCSTVDRIVTDLVSTAVDGEHIVFMSNGAFDNIQTKFLQLLSKRA
jgi:UDP-N-acetylmuramate: L-alanyl-gamma-D-glutamyl-meso-diaminopimelate ligase